MRSRCYNEKHVGFRHYGGRGIAVCPAWRVSFAAFFAYVGPRPTDKHSLGRINNDGDYEPGNVRWETPIEQHNNERRNRRFTFNGKEMTVAEISRATGIPKHTLYKRVQYGITDSRLTSRDSLQAPGPITHGTVSGYRKGCKCDDCKAANNKKARDFRARQASVTPPD